MIISNSTPLIHLGKWNQLDLLKKCFKEIYIPDSVYREVMAQPETMESKLLYKAVDNKWVVRKNIQIHLLVKSFDWIETAEKEVISLAFQEKGIALLDDHKAREVCKILNVECHGTLFVLALSYFNNYLKKKELLKLLNDLIAGGFYLSSEDYSKFVELIE